MTESFEGGEDPQGGVRWRARRELLQFPEERHRRFAHQAGARYAIAEYIEAFYTRQRLYQERWTIVVVQRTAYTGGADTADDSRYQGNGI